MDDLIVIILTLVLIVASSLGQLKKKTPGKDKVKDYTQGDSEDFWPLPGEDKAIKTEDRPVLIYKENQTNPEEVNASYQFKDDFTSVKPDYFTGHKKQSQSSKKISKLKFSLKKAVIYNEILNRKYT
jgi:hypothetical protein